MLYKNVCKILGMFICSFTLTMLVPLILALYYQFYASPEAHPQPHTTTAFLSSIILCFVTGICIYWVGMKTQGLLNKKEGLILVVLIWCITPAMAALPFIFSKTLENPIAAYFEATSGLTTTGSSVMQAKAYDKNTNIEIPIVKKYIDDSLVTIYSFYGNINPIRDPDTNEILFEGVEAVSKALLFWRSFIQWLGGIGIVVLFILIFPTFGMSGKILYQSEAPGLFKDALTMRIQKAAMQLLSIYLSLTLVQILILKTTNLKMDWLDAITISFSTISTGGFSIHNADIGYYHNATTEWVIIIFMIMGGINFSLFYYAFKGKLFRLNDPEFWIYLTSIFITCAIASWFLIGATKILLIDPTTQSTFSVAEAIRYGTFQMVSAHTSTGFSIANYDIWPYVVQSIMLIIMYIGGMSGSTAGSIKVIRFYMVFRVIIDKVTSIFRPEHIKQCKVAGQEIDSSAAITLLTYFVVALFISIIATVLFVILGVDTQTAVSLTVSSINNAGLAFRVAGPTESFAFLSDSGLLVSCMLMILGRLEFFAVLALLVPSFWKEKG